MNFKKALSVAAAAAMAVSIVAVSASATDLTSSGYANNGTLYLLTDGTNPSEGIGLTTQGNIDITSIYGLKLTFASSEDVNAGVGGGFGFNSESTGWKQIGEWSNKDGGKSYPLGDDNTITYTQSTPVFKDTDTYAQIWVQVWWGNISSIDVTVEALDKDGNVIDFATAIAEAEAAPAEENSEEAAPSAEAAEYSYKAVLGFADTAWSAQDWETSTTVTGNGQFTVESTAVAGASDFGVFVLDVEGLYAEHPEAKVVLDKIEIDGAEVPFDASKIIYGDIEEKGNYRIEIYNQYGDTKSDSGVTSTAINSSLKLTFTVSGIDSAASAEAAPSEEPAAEVAAEPAEEATVEPTVEDEVELADDAEFADDEFVEDTDDTSLDVEGLDLVQVAGEGSSNNWGQAIVLQTYNNIGEDEVPGDDAFDVSLLNEDNVLVVYYESDVAPELILQSWSGGEGWAKVPQNEELSQPGVAVFTYDYMTAMYQSDDFSTVDAVNIGDQGAELSVQGVYVVSLSAASEGADADVSITATEPDTSVDEAAPAADTAETTAPKTGNAGLASIAGVIAVAGAAAVAFKKRK